LAGEASRNLKVLDSLEIRIPSGIQISGLRLAQGRATAVVFAWIQYNKNILANKNTVYSHHVTLVWFGAFFVHLTRCGKAGTLPWN
jgi:hypothetical protein